MNRFYGRKALLQQVAELHEKSVPDHISVVGPRAIGKTALLQAVVARHVGGSSVFAGAGILDLRHDPPATTEAMIGRVASTLKSIFAELRTDHRELASCIEPGKDVESVNDQLKIALDQLATDNGRVLLVLDGCDALLQDSHIPRNLWEALRALAQSKALRLMTGTRAPLVELCYNPDAVTSDFFRIFYDQPVTVGSLDDDDWADVFASSGLALDGSAQKELRNWSGGHPDLVNVLVDRLSSPARASISKVDVDAVGAQVLERGSQRLDALWNECSAEVKGDLVQLAKDDVPVSEVPADRVRFMMARGLTTQSGGKLHLTSRLLAKKALARTLDVSGVRLLFGVEAAFNTNVRAVLEMRFGFNAGVDSELKRIVLRCIRHLPDEPDAALEGARSILDRALDMIWDVEAPGAVVPGRWLDEWKYAPSATRTVETYRRDRNIPEARGLQCDLLRIVTGKQGIRPVAAKVSKQAYVLIEHMNQLGNMKNHSKALPTLTMAVGFCFAAIELGDVLARDLR